jgi:hypothetical protein
LAEWLLEAGIGEDRAILVDGGEIVEALVELPSPLRAGAVLEARLTSILAPGRRAIATSAAGDELLVEPVPKKLSEGQTVRIELVREPIPERGRPKLARGRVTEAEVRAGPSLRDRLAACGVDLVAHPAHGADRFEELGWSELLEQAATGDIPFPGGGLRMSLTPAMTLFDVDGTLAPAELAAVGAATAGRTIRRLGIGGSIGIDLPTLSSRADRLAAAAALDAVLPQPFERTAVNGFGFLQVVRRRERPSLAEIVQGDRIGAAARALLRRAERTPGSGERTIHAAPAVIGRLLAHRDWVSELAARIGAPVSLRADPALAISAGHVQSAFA